MLGDFSPHPLNVSMAWCSGRREISFTFTSWVERTSTGWNGGTIVYMLKEPVRGKKRVQKLN